ncbi:outer-membrane lipoprotein carrier protein LolA [Pseudoalteromonas sp. SSDWG2]|uniref:outer-membrane lipoprotein carrier protein LolA n=1 Tax=Pseudoalteromonas sp. SSDWG2 TaxID=3139391 RepID=UPI003BAC68CF
MNQFLKIVTAALCYLAAVFTSSTFAQTLNGSFVQAKTFAGFSQPFISKGTFSIDKQQLVWHTLSPIDTKLRIDPTGVYERNKDGEYTLQTQTGSYGSLLQALLLQDSHKLESYFSIELLHEFPHFKDANGRCVKLLPSTSELQNMFTHFVSCSVDEQVRFVGLYEVSNAVTEINLTVDSSLP